MKRIVHNKDLVANGAMKKRLKRKRSSRSHLSQSQDSSFSKENLEMLLKRDRSIQSLSATEEYFTKPTKAATIKVTASRRSVQNVRLLDRTIKGSLHPDGNSLYFDQTFDLREKRGS